jgi:hypothetical protein
LDAFFKAAVYLLCFITSGACALLLARNYAKTRARLLMWSALCFCLLAANNLVVMIDLLVMRGVDLAVVRLSFSAAAVGVLLFGFIWDREE